MLQEQVDELLLDKVIGEGYAADLTEDEILQIGRDPFLIAYALSYPNARCVVTTEVSKPTRVRQNRHTPDVCRSLGVKCHNTFEMAKSLGFKTGWKPASGK